MFRSKKKLREQLKLLEERNIALSNALQSEKSKNRQLKSIQCSMKTAHQELGQQYDALRFKYMKVTAPKEMLNRNLKGR